MSLPDCKRQKLAEDVNPVANMSNISPKKECVTQTGNVITTASTSKKEDFFVISQNAQSFKSVASLDGFVDRTMLIEELLEQEPSYVMIFAPSKFGKTINLNMINFFCDIEDKFTKTKEDVAKDPTMHQLRSNPSKKMKVFLRQFEDQQYEECLILKREEFVIQHFGRHPVIFFNFKDYNPRNESEAIFACAYLVKKAYLENWYLKKSKEFQSDNELHVHLKKTRADWCYYEDDELKNLRKEHVIEGLQALIKSLRIHWGRDPVFLVDEIDRPCVSAMLYHLSANQVREIETVISDVIGSILKPGDKELKLQAALITGISRLSIARSSSVDNRVKVYFLGDARFSKYYALTSQEVDSLVRKFFGSEGDAEISEVISEINTCYNGYYQRPSSDEIQKPMEYARYCLYSVLSYIQEKIEDKNCLTYPFWTDLCFSTGLFERALKKSEHILCDVQRLLYDRSATIEIQYQETIDVEDILGIFCEEMVPDKNATFNFFLQVGFLAHNIEKLEKNVEGVLHIYVKIPNAEIKGKFITMLKRYYYTLPDSIERELKSCGQFFKSLPTVLKNFTKYSAAEFQNDLDQLCDNLTNIFTYMKCQSEVSICSHILSFLKHYAKYEKGEMNHLVEYLDNGNKSYVCINVWAQHGDIVLIFEVKYNAGECKTRSSLAAAEDIVTLLPKKKEPEDTSTSTKAGTGRDLWALKSPHKIDKYLLIGLAVDGNGTTHMLVFPNDSNWENVFQVNPENHVAELIAKHLNSK